ncbi:MAG: hypothetical protein MUC29_06065, partial [Pyrinomonadaceae bacterium]|nr:hypothetical protein [Pyrinomonadaceae bacterium]
MLKIILIALLPLLFPYSSSLDNQIIESNPQNQEAVSGTLEKLIVENGSATIDLNLETLNGVGSKQNKEDLKAIRFSAKENSFFTIIVFNGELRGALPSSMEIIPNDLGEVPANLGSSVQKFVVESLPFGEHYDLVVRDQESGLIAFNVDGYEVSYNPQNKIMSIEGGRLLISSEFANKLGRPSDTGRIVGNISINVKMRAIEISQIVDGESQKSVLPAGTGDVRNAGSIPGPDVVVGDVNGLAQFGGVSGTRVGISLGTDSCNFGQVDLNWFQMPNNDHPVIPQNLYRMSGGADNTERFEQIGQSRVKHGFTALTNNICGLGCNGVGGSRLGSGCSDPYSASLNSGSLSSRAWINPFTGAFPRGDSATPPGFSNSVNNRILTEINDLNTSLNAGATYYAEGQYVTPHEYTWCNANAANAALCEQNKNLFNNISYRRYNVTGTASPFSFSPVGSTVRAKSAIAAWTGATLVE